MYHVEKINDTLYVVHKESGEIMKYSSNQTDTRNIYEALIKDDFSETEVFWPWAYEYSTKDRKKVLNEMYNQECKKVPVPTAFQYPIDMQVSYGSCSTINDFVALATCPPIPMKTCGTKKKEEDMTTCTKSDAMVQRDYLISELRSVSMTKRSEAEKTFGLRDDDRPNTFTQLLARITSGKYTIDDKYKDRNTYGCPTEYIRWRDPAVKEDQAGYDAFVKAVHVASTATERTIKIAEPAAGLDALVAFEAMTFSPTVH